MASTMIELVDELSSLPETPEIAEIIREAKAGEFHDFKNNKYACGKVEVVGRLRAAAASPATTYSARGVLLHLAERVINGDYDEVADDDDIEMMRATTPPELHKILGLERHDA